MLLLPGNTDEEMGLRMLSYLPKIAGLVSAKVGYFLSQILNHQTGLRDVVLNYYTGQDSITSKPV